MTTPRSAAQAAIAIAGLSPTTERNAMRLLARANEDNGHILTDWATLCGLFEVGNSAVVRRHLGMMQTAKIIHYSTNQYVYINFHAWTARVGDTETVIPDHSKRAPTRASDPAPAENAAPQNPTDALQRAPDLLNARVGTTESARGRAIGGDNRGGRLVGINSFPIPGENLLPTNPPVAQSPQLQPWEAAASEGLLLAVGCESLTAIRATAHSHPFEAIRAHALAWQRDTKTTGPGGLLNRIRSGNFAVPEITASDRESSLFFRWRTPAELTADQEQDRQAEEEERRWEERQAKAAPVASAPGTVPTAPDSHTPTAPTAPAPGRLTPGEIWQTTLNELTLSMPAPTFETWVRDTDCLSYADGQFVIGVPHAYARDWLQNRLRPQIKRILGRLLQRSVEVTFAVRPRPNHATS